MIVLCILPDFPIRGGKDRFVAKVAYRRLVCCFSCLLLIQVFIQSPAGNVGRYRFGIIAVMGVPARPVASRFLVIVMTFGCDELREIPPASKPTTTAVLNGKCSPNVAIGKWCTNGDANGDASGWL